MCAQEELTVQTGRLKMAFYSSSMQIFIWSASRLWSTNATQAQAPHASSQLVSGNLAAHRMHIRHTELCLGHDEAA